MVDYIEAIKRPFSDLRKSGLAALFIWIPIVSFFSLGYFLECAKTSSKNKRELPEWENYKEKFIKGFLYMIISLIYALPLIGVFSILFIKFVDTLFIKNSIQVLTTGDLTRIMPAIINLFLTPEIIGYIIAALVLGFIAAYLVPMALILYTLNEKFSYAFNFREIFKRVLTKKYAFAWAVAGIYYTLLNSILGFVPFVGGIIASALGGITSYTIYGSVYREIKV